MRCRALVIGLDGADLDVVQALGSEQLPELHRLMRRGAFAALRSVQPPATLPNWTTFLTGVDPGRHGVFDFTTRAGYRVRFSAGTVREAPTVFRALDARGMRTACVGFPATWPPERLAHGVFISGWDSPVAFEADASFVWPRALYHEIAARFGPPRFDDVDEFAADEPGWHERLPDALCRRVERKTELGEWLLGRHEWDVFALYFGESDTASHHLWSLHDPDSPRHPRATPVAARECLTRVYRSLDAAVGRLVACAGGEEVEVTIVSDHGSGGASDKVLYLNRALEEMGWLRMRRGAATHAFRRAKDLALTRLGPRARQRLFGLAGRALPGWLESRQRFGSIDMRHTRAFSDELNYFPAIHWNLRGREPRGQLEPRAREQATAELRADLLQLRDPYNGQQVIRRVWRREELFDGPFVERAPDLLLELALDEGYSYNLMPSSAAPAGTGSFRRLAPDEYLGRKGRSLPGSHRPEGFFVAAGPRVRAAGRVHAHIADATATLLARLDLRPPPDASGRPLAHVLEGHTRGDALEASPYQARDRGDQALVEKRLRALGYIE